MKLSSATLASLPQSISRPGYHRGKVVAGIVHFGTGNFHKAHQALYVDRCLHIAGQSEWGVIGVSLGFGTDAIDRVKTLKEQDCLYTLTEFSPGGEARTRVIGAIVDYIHAPSEPARTLAALTRDQTKIVSLTITEGGYNINERTGHFVLNDPAIRHDLENPATPRSVFGFIVEAIARRRTAGADPFTIVSCDNLRGNGDVSRKAVLGFARARSRDLAEWIEANVAFPNSMVDRIAPTVTAIARDTIRSESGVDDNAPTIAESYLQWVVEDHFPSGRPAFELVGVELREDVKDFEWIKGRLLNASHMMLSYPAILAGHRFVHEAMEDPSCVAYLRAFMNADVIPRISAPRGVSLEQYARDVVDRFGNRAVGDQLLRIAHDGLSKLPIFLTATIAELRDDPSSDLRRVALLLACFRRYFDGIDCSGHTFDVKEPNLKRDDADLLRGDDPLGILKISAFAPLRLSDSRRFISVFADMIERLNSDGITQALNEVGRRK